jgi:hypothetical protein
MHRGGRTDQQQAEPIGDVPNQGGEIAAIDDAEVAASCLLQSISVRTG